MLYLIMNYKMQKTLAVLLVTVLSALGDSERYEEPTTRRPRFISFETTDENIRVDLDFSIPFLSIPIKRTLESTIGSSDLMSSFPTVNINVAGMLLGGAVVLASTFLLPFFLKTLAVEQPGAGSGHHHQHYARFLESSEFESDALLRNMNALLTSDRRALSCARRLVCWTARSAPSVFSGPSKAAYMLREMASNGILNSLLNGTSIDAAFKAGSLGHNCTESYRDCPVSHDSMQTLMSSVAKLGRV